jgi:Ca-activated chloride channel homolog
MKKLTALVFLVMLTAILLMNSCSSMTTSATHAPASTSYTTHATTTYTNKTTLATTTHTATRPTATSTETIGLAVGGAKDINNFRENIRHNYLPLPTDISYEGLFYDYYFDTGNPEETNKLFSPSYSYAVTRDPLSNQTEYYLSVGLNSGIHQEDFHRKILNLVIVLDSSGSMGESYTQYFYDQFGNLRDPYAGEGNVRLTKLGSAQNAVLSILNQLKEDDRFAIVQFNSQAYTVKSMGLVANTNMSNTKSKVADIKPGGSTDLSAGFHMAVNQFRNLREVESYDYENRIIVLTDAQPNTGEFSSSGLSDIITGNAQNRIYTTFIGIGVDFNTELMDLITKTKGANYYSVRSPGEFRERVENEFDFMVTPMVFNVNLLFESSSWKIDTVFGSPESDSATGRLMKINTLFPSNSVGGEVKGGLVLLKLKRISSNLESNIYLKVTYEDRDGRMDGSEDIIQLEGTSPEYFDNSGIRKGILLTRYAALLKNWMIDQRNHAQYRSSWDSCINEHTGIVIPSEIGLSAWERLSIPLIVSAPYGRMFDKFSQYFESEMKYVGDYDLDQELQILKSLRSYQ